MSLATDKLENENADLREALSNALAELNAVSWPDYYADDAYLEKLTSKIEALGITPIPLEPDPPEPPTPSQLAAAEAWRFPTGKVFTITRDDILNDLL